MRFEKISPRSNWKELASSLGYMSAVLDDPPYWIEACAEPFCAVFEAAEITDLLEPATAQILAAANETVERICNGADSEILLDRLKTPVHCREAIRTSWNRGDKSLWGRLDFSYNDGQVKLLEFNFDGAVSLYESAIFQRLWFDELQHNGVVSKNTAQSNNIHESLVEALTAYAKPGECMHFAAPSNEAEEVGTVKYLQSCAVLAGIETDFLQISEIGHGTTGGLFDLQNRPIKQLVKLYPWEYLLKQEKMIAEKTGHYVMTDAVRSGETSFYEPIWRSLLSNKGVLALMYGFYPNLKWLLPAAFDGTDEAEAIKKRPYARKPVFGMQGCNVSLVYPDRPSMDVSQPGDFGGSGYIVQELAPLSTYDDLHMLVGSWVVAGKAAGLSIRADKSPITTGTQCLFVPHYVKL
jgi:glutathionylspermidine synthase